MTPKQYSAPSVRQLAAVVDGLAWEVSAERLRQLRMVVGMWDRAVGRDEMPGRATRGVQQLFTRPALEAFWDLAVAGELRHLKQDRGRELPVATQRIVRDCLVLLGRRVLPAGRVLEFPWLPQPELKGTVAPQGVAALYRGLVDLAGQGPLEGGGAALSFEDRTRLLAMVAVVLDSTCRSGELTAMRLDGVAAGEEAVGVRRRQQKAPPNRVGEIAALAEVHPASVREVLSGRLDRSEETRQRVLAAVEALEPLPEVEWYGLREGSRVALRRWLAVREGIVGALPLEGARTELWVTLVPTKAGPAGVPIRAQGLRKAFERGMVALNLVMAGEYGWEPMPTRMEQLRRSVDVVPLEGPPAG
ncbi:hypothetical protein ACFRCX_30200 [Streptomyces sp. NPDC056652]|uniref:hypothetical protein n=1 Tax=Streptomyces sp. NPDC056652 TaxID=3345893 RepID=UPI003674CA07